MLTAVSMMQITLARSSGGVKSFEVIVKIRLD